MSVSTSFSLLLLSFPIEESSNFLMLLGWPKGSLAKKILWKKPERTFWPINISLVDNILRAKWKEEADISLQNTTFLLTPLFSADVPGAEPLCLISSRLTHGQRQLLVSVGKGRSGTLSINRPAFSVTGTHL